MHLRTVLVVLAVVLAVVSGAWVAAQIVAANPPEPLSLQDTAALATLDTSEPFDPDGTWTVGEGSEAGYRLSEELVAGESMEVVGRTTAVTGTVTVERGALTAGEITIDVAAIASDESARDSYFRRAMDTSTYPTAEFRLTGAVPLPDLTSGRQQSVTLTGTLSLHGVARPVAVEARVQRTVDGIEVAGRAPVTLADHGLTAPDLLSTSFVAVDPDGTVEFLLLLVP